MGACNGGNFDECLARVVHLYALESRISLMAKGYITDLGLFFCLKMVTSPVLAFTIRRQLVTVWVFPLRIPVSCYHSGMNVKGAVHLLILTLEMAQLAERWSVLLSDSYCIRSGGREFETG